MSSTVRRAREMIAMPGDFPPAPAGSGLRTVPGGGGLPLVGETPALIRDLPAWARRRYARYGPVSWANILGLRVVIALGPDAGQTILINKERAFANGPAWGYLIGPFFRRGILLLDFEEHLHHRRIMQQAFSAMKLQGYLAAMNPSIARSLDSWKPGQEFLVLPAVKKLTLDVASGIFLGEQLGAQTERVNAAFIDMVGAGMSMIRFPVPGGRWSKGLAGRKMMEEFFSARIAAKRTAGGDDLFSALCEARTEEGEVFTDADVINHMIFLLMAAHDTTTITMTSMLYQLGRHPEWQDRAREESWALGKPTVEFDDLDKLVALDLVMKESLRLLPPISGFPRHTLTDTEIDGYFVPAGTTVITFPSFAHHMSEYWSKPTQFDPERFGQDRREDRVHKFAWEPFGGGVHKCIGMHFAGMQIKAVLHQLLLRYRVTIESGYRTEWDYRTLPVPKDGLPVRLTPI
ncbi:cytochrome P450 Cyp136B2 family protein [Mycobacteroides abscessus subsp. abscessus]|nr:cytochrome P450 Cyp136B2 family protein [Mycobacteroides abscessus subsp. abscessus]